MPGLYISSSLAEDSSFKMSPCPTPVDASAALISSAIASEPSAPAPLHADKTYSYRHADYPKVAEKQEALEKEAKEKAEAEAKKAAEQEEKEKTKAEAEAKKAEEKRLAEEKAKAEKIKVILVQEQFNQKPAERIAANIDAHVVQANPLPEDLPNALRALTQQLLESWR